VVTTGAGVGAGVDAAEVGLIIPVTAIPVAAVRSSATAPARIRFISLFLPSFWTAGGSALRSTRSLTDAQRALVEELASTQSGRHPIMAFGALSPQWLTGNGALP
jgi:hypothetical protein